MAADAVHLPEAVVPATGGQQTVAGWNMSQPENVALLGANRINNMESYTWVITCQVALFMNKIPEQTSTACSTFVCSKLHVGALLLCIGGIGTIILFALVLYEAQIIQDPCENQARGPVAF